MLIFFKGMNPEKVLELMQRRTGLQYVGGIICYKRDHLAFYPETQEELALIGDLPQRSFVHVLEDLGYNFDNT